MTANRKGSVLLVDCREDAKKSLVSQVIKEYNGMVRVFSEPKHTGDFNNPFNNLVYKALSRNVFLFKEVYPWLCKGYCVVYEGFYDAVVRDCFLKIHDSIYNGFVYDRGESVKCLLLPKDYKAFLQGFVESQGSLKNVVIPLFFTKLGILYELCDINDCRAQKKLSIFINMTYKKIAEERDVDYDVLSDMFDATDAYFTTCINFVVNSFFSGLISCGIDESNIYSFMSIPEELENHRLITEGYKYFYIRNYLKNKLISSAEEFFYKLGNDHIPDAGKMV